jgi:predicted transcriptional regulator
MTHRRSRLEIYLDVLWAIKKGISKPTRVMYEANLSWGPLQDILDSLVSKGLVEEFDVKHIRDKRSNVGYRLTQKGDNVVRYFRDASKMIKLDVARRRNLSVIAHAVLTNASAHEH